MDPYVTVLMSAYNAEKFISDAIESILNQSYSDYEFLIINDGSTDSTKDIIDSYSLKDERIQVLHNTSNKGLIFSLNRGLDVARGKYIARMDADDISLPNRLETQVLFMDSNEEIGAASAWMKTFGKFEDSYWRSPLKHDTIMARMFCYNSLWHSLAIIRKEILELYNIRYDSRFPKAEDYKFWYDIAKHKKLANIPEVLLRYRTYDQQKTIRDKEYRVDQKNHLQYRKDLPGIREQLLTNFLSREVTLDEIELHAKLFFEIPFEEYGELTKVREWVDFLISVNKNKNVYVEPAFNEYLQETLSGTVKKSFKYGWSTQKRYSLKMLWNFFFSKSCYYSAFTLKETMILTMNCLTYRMM